MMGVAFESKFHVGNRQAGLEGWSRNSGKGLPKKSPHRSPNLLI